MPGPVQGKRKVLQPLDVGGGGEHYPAPVAWWMLGLWHWYGPGAVGEGCFGAAGVPGRAHYTATVSGANEHPGQQSLAWDGDFR